MLYQGPCVSGLHTYTDSYQILHLFPYYMYIWKLNLYIHVIVSQYGQTNKRPPVANASIVFGVKNFISAS